MHEIMCTRARTCSNLVALFRARTCSNLVALLGSQSQSSLSSQDCSRGFETFGGQFHQPEIFLLTRAEVSWGAFIMDT